GDGSLDSGASFSALSSGAATQCTAQLFNGFDIGGTLCGGSAYTTGCTPGALYQCQQSGNGFPKGVANNCTLKTTCAVGCITSRTSSSPASVADSCYSGPSVLQLPSSSIFGGADLSLTAVFSGASSAAPSASVLS